jgi:hypothetical protein
VLQQHTSKDNSKEKKAVPSDLQLMVPENQTILEDDDLLSEYEIKDNAVLHVVFEVAENEFETVDIESTDVQDS